MLGDRLAQRLYPDAELLAHIRVRPRPGLPLVTVATIFDVPQVTANFEIENVSPYTHISVSWITLNIGGAVHISLDKEITVPRGATRPVLSVRRPVTASQESVLRSGARQEIRFEIGLVAGKRQLTKHEEINRVIDAAP